LRETHSFRGEFVDVRRLKLLLSVAAQFTVAQVIGENKNDIRFAGRFSRLCETSGQKK